LYDVLQNIGQIKVHSGGIVWKKQGGGKAVKVDRSNISRDILEKVTKVKSTLGSKQRWLVLQVHWFP